MDVLRNSCRHVNSATREATIQRLREYLIRDKPESVYHARRNAVELLAGLGATDALIDYLRSERDLSDPIVRQSEYVVENAAVRELSERADDTILDFLRELAMHRLMPSAEAFGRHHFLDELPYLDRALEDDICRGPAEDAFRKLGALACDHLLLSALTPLPSHDSETPSSVLRRASAVSLLGEIGIDRQRDWPRLVPLIDAAEPRIVLTVCLLAANSELPIDASHAVKRLLAIGPALPSVLHEDLAHCLAAWFAISEPLLKEEVNQGIAALDKHHAFDRLLQTFVHVLNNGRH